MEWIPVVVAIVLAVVAGSYVVWTLIVAAFFTMIGGDFFRQLPEAACVVGKVYLTLLTVLAVVVLVFGGFFGFFLWIGSLLV